MVDIKRANAGGFDKLRAAMKGLENKQLKVGWDKTSNYPAAEGQPPIPVAYVATIQEFGSSKNKIPPRPFMRPTVNEKTNDWSDVLRLGAQAVLAGNVTTDTVLGQFGFVVEGDIVDTIKNVNSPVLSPITIQLRAWRRQGRVITGKTVGEAAQAVRQPGWTPPPGVSQKPLNDSGHMISTITHIVEDA